MATPATPITFKLENKTTDQIAIRSITYVDDSNVTHHADYSNFAYGGTDNTGTTTVITHIKQYVTGDYLQRSFVSDTHDRTVHYSTHTGSTLNIENDAGFLTTGIGPGWTADSSDGAYNGTQYVVSITSATQIIMSAPPLIPNPIVSGSIVFSSSTNKIVISDTTGIYAGWEIRDNGYTTPGNVLSVEDSQTLVVDILPNNPEPGNSMLFTTSTNYLTLSNTNSIEAGWTASSSDDAYDDSQYVLLVVDGNTVQMSAQPNSAPSTSSPANQITFTSNQSLATIDAGTTTTFSVNYTNNNSTPATNYPSVLTINARNLGNNANIVGFINNFVSINLPPPPPSTYTSGREGSGRGGSRGGSGEGSTAGASVGHRGLSDGNQSIGNNPDGMGGQTGGGGGGGSRVICTHFYRKGMISRDVWRADMEYTFKCLSPATVRGYQYWAIPYVKLMRASPLAEKIMYPLMMARAEELAYKMGVLEKRNWAGVLVRLVFEPICFTIGLFVGEQDWKSLWNIKSDRTT